MHHNHSVLTIFLLRRQQNLDPTYQDSQMEITNRVVTVLLDNNDILSRVYLYILDSFRDVNFQTYEPPLVPRGSNN